MRKFIHTRPLIIGILMALAAALALFLTPTIKYADKQGKIDLETLIPSEFGDWKIDKSIVPLQVSPDVEAALNKIYGQILSRTYVNAEGKRIMLSIAYGGDQSRSLQAHKPETCYAAQGFTVGGIGNISFDAYGNQVKARRLLAVSGARHEPITYWMRVGDTTVYGGLEQTIKRFQMGVKGYIPDGLLFRVSSIDGNSAQAYTNQEAFIQSLLASVTPENRSKLIGMSVS